MTFFNEIDPFAAQWIRELMKVGVITEGEVDERPVEDIAPVELRGYRRVHLFGGIGVWDYALALAGFPADRPVWTCSCPCQPFSSAGKGDGFADERHLWPAAFHLIRECRPELCFGEQVASDDGFAWLDLVQADLEGVGYTVGAVVTPAAGYGAPHGRHRIYWCASLLADVPSKGRNRRRGRKASKRPSDEPERLRDARELADSGSESGRAKQQLKRGEQPDEPGGSGTTGELGNADGNGLARPRVHLRAGRPLEEVPDACGAGAVNGFWFGADWLHCAPEPGYPAGRWRPVEPGSFPLAHGAPARVGRLRGFGNCIVATQAAAWIKAFLEEEGDVA